MRLETPDGGGGLTLNCLWLSEPPQAELASLVDVERFFPKSRNVRPIEPLDVSGRSLGLAGEVALERREVWWKRPFEKRRWQPWRLWAIQEGSVCLVASFLQTGTPDPEQETIARMILNTVSLNAQPADPPGVFVQRVMQLARDKFPLLECQRCDEFQIKMGESNVNLFNFYRQYVKSPEKFEEILLPALTTVVQVQEWGDQQTSPPLESVRDRIMPMLYPEAVWRERFPNFVGEPWVAGLMILYVVDESNAYWYIRDDLLENWNLTANELHELALDNLDAYFEKNKMEFSLAGEEGGAKLLMPTRADAYNTSRLLSRTFHQQFSDLLGQQFAVGIPSRDFCVAVSLDSSETVQHVRRQVLEDYSKMDHPLSQQLLLVSADGVSEYVDH